MTLPIYTRSGTWKVPRLKLSFTEGRRTIEIHSDSSLPPFARLIYSDLRYIKKQSLKRIICMCVIAMLDTPRRKKVPKMS